MQTTDRDHQYVVRPVRIGGIGRLELLAELQRSEIELNQASLELFANDRFSTAAATLILDTVDVTVAELGFPHGNTIDKICERAVQLGMSLCPLELGPHLRLQYRDQPEGHVGHPSSKHRAPPGSLTVASPRISEDDDVPKGFYLRRIDGVLWLRGYRSGAEHIGSGKDHFAFIVPPVKA